MLSIMMHVYQPQFDPGVVAKFLHHQRLEAAVNEPVLERTQTFHLVQTNVCVTVSSPSIYQHCHRDVQR